jgi:hypothetical protein
MLDMFRRFQYLMRFLSNKQETTERNNKTICHKFLPVNYILQQNND